MTYYWTKDNLGMLWPLQDHSYDNTQRLAKKGIASFMSFQPDGSDLFRIA